MTEQSLRLFADLLSQVKLGPLDEGSDLKWKAITAARDEVIAELNLINQAKEVAPIDVPAPTTEEPTEGQTDLT